MRRTLRIAGGCAAVCAVLLPPMLHFVAKADWSLSFRVGVFAGVGVGSALLFFWCADRVIDWVLMKISSRKPMNRTQRNHALAGMATTLDQIETEMRRIGYWQDDPPDLLALCASGEIKSYLDAPSFELWLQCVFLPNARAMLRDDRLPASSSVGVMAMRQYNYHSYVEDAQELLGLLCRFDGELNRYVGHDPLSPTSA